MSLVKQARVKTKSDLVRALASSRVSFISEDEPETDADLRQISERVRTMIKSGKRIHVVLVERAKGSDR